MNPIPIRIHDMKHNTIPISTALYLPIHTSANRPNIRKESQHKQVKMTKTNLYQAVGTISEEDAPIN